MRKITFKMFKNYLNEKITCFEVEKLKLKIT